MILILVGLLCAGPPSLGEKVVAFARSKLGQTVGDGDCAALAIEAMRHAGASRPRSIPGTWGDERKSLQDSRPGDILQFEQAVFIRRRLRDDGALFTQTFSMLHHTAIVARVRKRGPKPVLVILHQNAGLEGGDNNRVVQEWTIDLAAKQSGTVTAYRPVADRPAGPAGEERARPAPAGPSVTSPPRR